MSLTTSLSKAAVMTTTINLTPQLVTATQANNLLVTQVGDCNVITSVQQPQELTELEDRTFSTTVNVPSEMGLITNMGVMLYGTQNEAAVLLDGSTPIAYVGYETKIKKLDYSSGWPPSISTYLTQDLQADWDNRQSLGYTKEY